MNYLEGLNKEQKDAAAQKDGPLLIVAGAGAGKTKTITHRIANMIGSGVKPEEILAVTFTNKAAKEMLERVEDLIDFEDDIKKPTVCTFHSLGVRILRENAQKFGMNRFFTILDSQDSLSLVKESMKELGIDPKINAPRTVQNVISRTKNNFINLNDYETSIDSHSGQVYASVWRLYENKKEKEKAFDFDDLLIKTVELLEKNNEILEAYQERWKYIHVDEYQDTNKAQYLIIKMLAEKYNNICVVGDADQNIYSWRGANITNMLNFEKDYPKAKIIFLEQNYRSTKTIIEAANEVIKKNIQRIPKKLFTENEEGEMISIFEAYSDKIEAEFVAEKIVEMADAGADLNSIAVLYRANFQSRLLEEYMLQYSVSYQVLGVKFFDRKEVKDILSYLKAALNRESLTDIKRTINVPKRGIGKVTIAKLFAGKKEELPEKTLLKINSYYNILDKIKNYAENHVPSEIIKFVIEESGIEDDLKNSKSEDDLERLENIKEIVTFAIKYDKFENKEGIGMLLEEAALTSDQDTLNTEEKKKKNGVKLMTVHASKGLEFKHVFIVGLENELFPHIRDNSKDSDLEEERRLFYVALTRAKDKLFLSFATMRILFGETRLQETSQFLKDIPDHLIHREEREHSGFGNNIVYLD